MKQEWITPEDSHGTGYSAGKSLSGTLDCSAKICGLRVIPPLVDADMSWLTRHHLYALVIVNARNLGEVLVCISRDKRIWRLQQKLHAENRLQRATKKRLRNCGNCYMPGLQTCLRESKRNVGGVRPRAVSWRAGPPFFIGRKACDGALQRLSMLSRRSLQRYYYFSSSVSSRQIPDSLRDLTQPVTPVDNRRYLSSLHERAQVG